MSYQRKVFLLLTSGVVVAVVAWQGIRDRTHDDEREVWLAIADSVDAQQERIDSLQTLLARLDRGVTEGTRQIDSAQERIAFHERRAVDGKLPPSQLREYERAIDAHNALVVRHNEALVEIRRIYEEYGTLVDAHNAHVDSANAMRRRATQEGYALPDPD
jgi:predicted  nucleic acid-binding Zn-ribbon protein